MIDENHRRREASTGVKRATLLRRCAAVGALLLGVLDFPVAAQSLKVGFFELPPHAYLSPTGAPTGAAVAYFSAVAKKMGVTEVTFVQLPLPRLLDYLERGEMDVALLLGKNPERDAKFIYPSKPFYLAQPVLAVRADAPLREIKSAADLMPLIIGVRQAAVLPASMQTPGLKLEALSGDLSDQRNLAKMLLGRLDAVYHLEANVMRWQAKEAGSEAKIRILALPDAAPPIYTVFNKKTGAVFAPKYVQAMEAVNKEQGDYLKAWIK